MAPEPRAEPTVDFAARLQAARIGGAAALGLLLEAVRPYLLRTANASLDERWRAKASGSDLVQETFLEAARQFARFEGTTQRELMAWLHGILVNKVRTLARHYTATEKRQAAREVPLTAPTDSQPAHDPAAPGPTPSGHAIAAETDAHLRAALERLPAHYRQVIVWRQWEELPFEEIAQRLGKGVDAARMLWWRAVAQLQRQLRPNADDVTDG